MIEIPPRFAGKAPVSIAPARTDNPLSADDPGVARAALLKTFGYYGQWIRDEAEAYWSPVSENRSHLRDGPAERPDLKPLPVMKLTVIAWLWARTVKSPNPAFVDVDVPLVSTFILSTRAGQRGLRPARIVERDTYSFAVVEPAMLQRTYAAGTKLAIEAQQFPLRDVRNADRAEICVRPKHRHGGHTVNGDCSRQGPAGGYIFRPRTDARGDCLKWRACDTDLGTRCHRCLIIRVGSNCALSASRRSAICSRNGNS